MPAEHKFLKFILPGWAFADIEAATRLWLIECPCGHKRDLWDAGGVRYIGAGHPRQWGRCPECRRRKWHTIRKKTDAEKRCL